LLIKTYSQEILNSNLCLQWSGWNSVQQYCEIDVWFSNGRLSTGEGAKGAVN